MNIMDKGIILDSSAIFRSNLDFTSGNYYVTSDVLSEINDPRYRDAIDYAIRSSHIKIIEINEKHLKTTIKASKDTGDIDDLSQTDLGIIACALEYDLTVASDDYAIQNVCNHLRIKISKTVHEGIKKIIKWKYVCSGCLKEMNDPGTCSVCGHNSKKIPRKN